MNCLKTRSLRFALQFGAILLALLLFWSGWRAHRLGFFRAMPYANTPATITYIDGVEAAEDIALMGFDIRKRQIAYVSSCQRTPQGQPVASGAIYRLVFEQGHANAPQPEKMQLHGFDEEFYPHGLDVKPTGAYPYGPYPSTASAEHFLYVVNDRLSEPPTVEVFRVEGMVLRHVQTLRSRLLTSPNDLSIAWESRMASQHTEAPFACFVTNDSGYGDPWMRSLAVFFGLNRGNVLRLDPDGEVEVVAGGLAFPNGILGAWKEWVVADTLSGKLVPSDSRQEPLSVGLETGLDAINLADEYLWLVVQHVNLWKLARAIHRDGQAPTLILAPDWGQLHAEGEGKKPFLRNVPFRVVFADDGRRFSGASTAVNTAQGLLLGSLAEGRLALVRPE